MTCRLLCGFLLLVLIPAFTACGKITVRVRPPHLASTKLADPVPIEAEGVWTHAPSGIAFDEGGPTWQRSDIQRYDEEGHDIGVGYDWGTPHGPAILTIYVFPPPVLDGRLASLEAHMREERRTLEASLGQTTPLQVVEDDAGRVIALEYEQMPPVPGPPTLRSILVLHTRGSWRIKYRLTLPARARDETVAALDTLAERLDLPASGLPRD